MATDCIAPHGHSPRNSHATEAQDRLLGLSLFNCLLIHEWSGREDLNLRLHGPEPCALPGCATPRRDRLIVHKPGHVSHAYFPTSLTNLHSPHSRVFISPPTFSTSVSTWFTASPIGTTIRPPSASCWKSGGGTPGAPAGAPVRRHGASARHPSGPLPTRTPTFVWPRCSRRARAPSARGGSRPTAPTRRARPASTPLWQPQAP